MPEQFLTRLSASQARLGTSRMNHLQADVARRRVIADAYGDWLVRRGRSPAIEPPDQESAFLRYPLRVTDRAPFVAEAERSGIDLGDWFVSPVHPVLTGLDRWGYLDGSAPNAERACREVVNLPTHPSLGDKAVERVIAFLGRNVDLIV
jgi:dTDP-4-amino-4,6-dideoxygalactose transaminase